jgi:Putative Ig domain
MKMPCPNAVTCPGSDSPIANFSSEAPDQTIYLAINWGTDDPPGTRFPPGNPDCVIFAESLLNRQEAEQCGGFAQIECRNGVPIFELQPTCTVTPSNPSGPPVLPFNPAHPTGPSLAGFSGFSCAAESYSFTLSAYSANPPVVFAVTDGALPDGLILDAGGLLHGTPTTPGDYSFTVTVTDASHLSDSKPMSFMVLGITNDSPLPDITACETCSIQIGSGGGGSLFEITDGSLPGGLSMDEFGLITGIPNAASVGTTTFTVTVTDEFFNSCSKKLDLTVKAPTTPCFSSGNPPDADTTPATPYSFQLIPTKPTTSAYNYTISAGALPTGLSINSATGLISGQATTPGTYTFTVALTGVCWPCSTQYTMDAKCQPLISDTPPSPPPLTTSAVGTVTSGPFYIIQRTGANKVFNFGTSATINSSDTLGESWGFQIWNDETNVMVAQGGGNSGGGGPADHCSQSTGDNSSTYSMESCVRYKIVPFLILSGTNPFNCSSTINYTTSW